MLHEAINDCNSLMKLNPDYTGAYYIRGCANEKMGKIDEAIDDFSTVLQIDPYHVNALYARGACENKWSNFDKAIEDYNMALQIDQQHQDRWRITSPPGGWWMAWPQQSEMISVPTQQREDDYMWGQKDRVLKASNLNQEQFFSPTREWEIPEDDHLQWSDISKASFAESVNGFTNTYPAQSLSQTCSSV